MGGSGSGRNHAVPTALRVALGTRPGRTLGERAGDVPIEPLDACPPSFLDDVGAERYAELHSQLSSIRGLLAQTDRDTLAIYCDAYSDYMRALAEIRKRGDLIATDYGLAVNPAIGLKARALERMHKTGVRLGLSPVDRARVAARAPKQSGPISKLAELRQGRSSGAPRSDKASG